MTVQDAADIFIRALCVWREMRGEDDESRLGCYWVICNRMLDAKNRWPKTLYGVVTQPRQFSSFDADDPNSTLLPHPGNGDWQAWLEISSLCERPGEDPTGGANAYEDLPVAFPKPSWADPAKLSRVIGRTRFYRL